jgi:glycosyltransferase involved in cell wall biosynthesis
MASSLSITVVVPTHDRPECLRRLTGCLLGQTLPPAEIVLVNDGQAELESDLLDSIRSAGISLRVLRRSEPSSAASRNAGLTAAGGDIVVCLDDDMLPGPRLLAEWARLYELDTRGVVAGIGVAYEEAQWTWRWRVWQLAFLLLGRVRWAPRRQASRYVRLGPGLAGLLAPARMIPGGGLSLRGPVARRVRFDESLAGYSFGEDREFTFRVGREWPLFVARRLRVGHAPVAGGRGDWRQRGRVYVDNVLHIVSRSVDPGPGTDLLVAIDFVGAIVQHTIWAIGTRRWDRLGFPLGMAEAIGRQGWFAIRRMLCGRC